MSEPTQAEINAAAERYRANQYDRGKEGAAQWCVDGDLLINAYLAHLAAAEAAEAERAKPIDAEWLRGLGFVPYPGEKSHCLSFEDPGTTSLDYIEIYETGYTVIGRRGVGVGPFNRRGQLLDLLSAMGIENAPHGLWDWLCNDACQEIKDALKDGE